VWIIVSYSPEFSVTTSSLNGYSLVSVRGELDMVTAPGVDEALALCNDGRRIIVDLRNVTFLASHGIRVLFKERLGERPALVIEPESHLTRLLDMVDAKHNVPVFRGLDAAIQWAMKDQT
jgi:anti-anti-sigma factor